MDPLTHVMGGAVVAHVFSGAAAEPAASLTAIGAAILPDLDFYSRKLPGAAFLRVHHGATHSILGVLLQSFVCAATSFYVFNLGFLEFQPSRFLVLFAIALTSVFSHIALDWIMHNNGLPLLWPFSSRRFLLPLVLGVNPQTVSHKCKEKHFITCFGCQFRGSLRNPVAWIITAGGFAGYVWLHDRRLIALAAVCMTAAYCILAFCLRERSRKALARFEPSAAEFDAYPGRARPDRWLFVKSSPEGDARVFLTECFSPAVLRKWNFPPPLISPFVQESSRRVIADLEKAVRHLYPEVTSHGDTTDVNFRDLSFLYSEPLELGSVHVILDAEGKIISETFQEVWDK
jgi:membrane-bound metal-dependent hydrolase YbcI (DUF457 family)